MQIRGDAASDTEMAALIPSGNEVTEKEPIQSEVSQDSNIDDAAETTDEEVVIADKDTAEEKTKDDNVPPAEDYKQEIIKRFGERPENELTQQVWKSYREMEKEFDRRNTLYKETLDVASKFGGIEALKQILSTPKEELVKPQAQSTPEKSQPGLPADIQELIDSGELDLGNPKDQMFIRRELAFREQEQKAQIESERNFQVQQQEAVKQFETFLNSDIAPKYEYADLNAIKAKAYAGAWRGLSDEAFKLAVEDEAKALHAKVESLAESKKEKALEELRKLKEKSVVVGKQTQTIAKRKTFREAFDSAYDENFGNRN